MKLASVATLTDYVVARHLPFTDAADYYAHYDLTGATLQPLAVPTRILAAADDPVIPIADFDRVTRPAELTLDVARHGGHCAFLHDFRGRSALGPYAAATLTAMLEKA